MGASLLTAGQTFAVPFHSRAGAFYRESMRTGEVLVSTEPLSLAFGAALTQLNTDWLSSWLCGDASSSESPYLGVYRILPGQRLVVHAHGQAIEDIVDYRNLPDPTLSGIDAITAFRETFDDVVSELAHGSSMVASTLSGGLDSSFMVSSLDRFLGGNGRLEIFTHVPHPQLPVEQRPGWLASDEPEVKTMLADLSTPYHWHTITNDPQQIPLQIACAAAIQSGWPVLAVDNIPWLQQLHARTHDLGLTHLWQGTHGNAAFSHTHPYARPRQTASLPRRIARRLNRVLKPDPSRGRDWNTRKVSTPESSRTTYLAWLFHRTGSHQALRNTAFSPVQVVDPYSHEKLLRLAANITPETWLQFGSNRGFAREVMKGRVPDAIRLRTKRGMQSADNWGLVTNRRELYWRELELAADTPILTECVDFDVLRAEMKKWPWGQPQFNREPNLHVMNRILSFAMFIRDTTARLYEHNRQLGN